MTIDVDNKLASNLDETAYDTALSLPDTDVNPNINAYAQGFRTGSSAQEIDEVKLAITVPSGTTPKVSIWHGNDKPEHEAEGLTLANPVEYSQRHRRGEDLRGDDTLQPGHGQR